MLRKPDVIETVNREVVPILINATTDEWPQVPALERWERDYHKNPWSHYIFAHYVVVGPRGDIMYGALSCQCLELMALHSPYVHGHRDLKKYIANYKKAQELRRRAATDETAKDELAKHLKAIQDEIEIGRICDTDLRFLTVRNLLDYGGSTWEEVLADLKAPVLGRPDPLVPGLRVLAIRALGDFITDETPFDPRTADHVRNMYDHIAESERNKIFAHVLEKVKARGGKKPTIADLPMPPSLLRRAAWSLGEVTGQGWKRDDPDLLSTARAWWRKHCNDEAYAHTVTSRR